MHEYFMRVTGGSTGFMSGHKSRGGKHTMVVEDGSTGFFGKNINVVG